MTKEESNGAVTVLSNPDLDPALLLRFVLGRVDGGITVHHPGSYGPMQGFGWINGARALADEQVALYGALDDGLITVCAPAVEGAEHPADRVRWLRLITSGIPVVTGNPVRITVAGEAELTALNASAVLVGAA